MAAPIAMADPTVRSFAVMLRLGTVHLIIIIINTHAVLLWARR